MKFDQLIEHEKYIMRNIFLEKLYKKCGDEASSRPFYNKLKLNISLIICCPSCDVITFEINFSLLFKPFSYTIKKSRQKCKYLENEKCF